MPRTFSSRLTRHLSLALLVKALALTALWNVFIAPRKVSVDAGGMAARIAAQPVSQSNLNMEKSFDDRSDRR